MTDPQSPAPVVPGEGQAEAGAVCEHFYASHCYRGMSIRLCMMCHEPDWDDLERQLREAAVAVSAPPGEAGPGTHPPEVVPSSVVKARDRAGAIPGPVTASVLRSQVRAAVHGWAETDMEADPADAVLEYLAPFIEQVVAAAARGREAVPALPVAADSDLAAAEMTRLRTVAAGGAREVRRAIDEAVAAERERAVAAEGKLAAIAEHCQHRLDMAIVQSSVSHLCWAIRDIIEGKQP